MYCRGFTLLELLVTASLIAILCCIGIPSLSNQLKASQVAAASQDFFTAIEMARYQSVVSNQRTVIRSTTNWSTGWEIFIDKNNNGRRDPEDRVIATAAASKGVRIAPNAPVRSYISFIGTGESRFAGRADGGAFQAGAFKICPATSTGKGYQVILARSGRPRMNEISATECEEDS